MAESKQPAEVTPPTASAPTSTAPPSSSSMNSAMKKRKGITRKSLSKTEGSTRASSPNASDDERKSTDQIGHNVGQAPIAIDREEYLSTHRELTIDRTQLLMKNNILHRRLAEYYKKRKLEHVLKALEGSADLEEKYQQKLFAFEELKEKEEREMADIKAKVQAVEENYAGRLEATEKKFDELQAHERSTGSGLIYSKKGKPIADKTVERFLSLQRKKQEQASALCLRYIRARNAVAELDAIIKKLEKIGPRLYVAHYEQLCIDNQNYMTKIEEREDELIKHRTKCSAHNQILAHIREKMHHTDEVIDFTECDYGDAEMEYQRAREDLGAVKTRRDKLRWSLEGERVKAGLLTRKDLLYDFQESTDMLVRLKDKKEMLETDIANTSNKLRIARQAMKLHSMPSQKVLDNLKALDNTSVSTKATNN